MYTPYSHQIQGGAGQPGHHASLPAYNPNMNTATPNPSQHQPQPQHMMYNPHQYAHQSPYGAGNPIMTGMPQMHNGGMAHGGGGGSNGVNHYQTPYTSSPYGSGLPTSTAGPGHPQAYQAAFAMNMQHQQQQQQQQRMMQPPPSSSTQNSHSGGPSRASPYAPPVLPHQMTPPNASNPHFAPHPSQVHQQNLPGQQQSLHPNQQSISQNTGGVQNHGQNQQQTSPSTPTYLPPLSPGAESREKERVGVLLDINRDLLMEVLRTQALQAEIRKEAEAEGGNPDAKLLERKNQANKDYAECMRRIQFNLAYLASIADRSHKPATAIPKYPQFMYAPPLSQTTTSFKFSSPMLTNATPPKSEIPSSPGHPYLAVKAEADFPIEKESRINSLKENYRRLQDLFGVTEMDVKKEMELQAHGRIQAQQQQQQSQQMYPQNQQQQSPISGIHQRLPSQQLTQNMYQNNMSSQMQGQGQSQQPMNLANSQIGMAGLGQNPAMSSMNMPNQVEMGFQRVLPGGGMHR